MTTRVSDLPITVEDGLATWTVEPAAAATTEQARELVKENAGAVLDHLHRDGALRVRGLRSVRAAKDFNAVVAEVLPALRDYVGGTSPREQVHGKIMTATYVPPDWSIILHQEMAYTRTLPAYLAFSCERPADHGGLSTWGDMRAALDRVDRGVRERLDRHGLRLGRTLLSPETVHLKPGVKKPWTEVFGTTDRAEVDRVAAERGWETEWIRDDAVRLYQEVVPAVREHPVTGVSVWCNQAHFFNPSCMMRWAAEDGREPERAEQERAARENPELLDRMYLGNGDPVGDDDALHVYRVLRELERGVALQATDLLLIDNLLVAHGRTAFQGERRILVALADRPEQTARNGQGEAQ
ncbi:TauD/TfdA family dioxygenase [Nonomuraea sp. NPDC004580]|uniref:TauD/TfdA family dioxygenase n=1 Tax=Nonomuraea sp. NPDC004580 TaxID=3154552 RepID=UPI0033BAE83E